MDYEQELKDLSIAYGAALPKKLLEIQSEWDHLKQHDKILSDDLIRKVHSLIGAGATFGFAPLSIAAKKLELALREYQQQGALPSQYTDSLEPSFTALESAAKQPCEYDINDDIHPPLLTTDIVDNGTLSILIISSNSLLITGLTRQLKLLKITTHILGSPSDLPATIERINPKCIVLELPSEQDPVDEIKNIKNITQRFYKTPSLIVISTRHDMTVRLSAVKAGASAYFLSPVNTLELVQSIYSQCYPAISPPYRVLIVDDDEQTAHHTALILQRSGTNIESCILTEPLNILQSLQSFKPEVILLDLYMPECDGIELATVIRQQCIYAGIAIVFFSVETAIERHIDALRVGGNDFLLKSMPPGQLIANIEAKANNARTLQSLMLYDSLTGLLNRSHFTETIAQQISVCQRSQDYFSYVMLDLDHFKQINDQYGHATGDEVLKALAELTKKCLRAVDSVFRFGGEEFVLVLPSTQSRQAQAVINDLLHKFRKLQFFSKEQPFSVTFSAGIAQYPDYPDTSCLAEAADKALYEAKNKGRNQVCLA